MANGYILSRQISDLERKMDIRITALERKMDIRIAALERDVKILLRRKGCSWM
ncbi:hypothetical protein EPUS_03141 [Endocarpon pusillum Z07020]|uniref:Uncharacterized protein n=1 Tax=Endocarpon pusillum (strain Z07020 / HMAS-L-300199) TaxID=1263415 RepID=U1GM36_ENDPU|nr:uncharacterized protein EPUS_03141 [Endocarpon pusillum Z07020]ERF73308.1 hypothetical protein EPUS_03141 [Endocarpon pusillum Z07020]